MNYLLSKTKNNTVISKKEFIDMYYSLIIKKLNQFILIVHPLIPLFK